MLHVTSPLHTFAAVMNKNPFKDQINLYLAKEGRKRQWLADKLQMDRIQLWRKLNKKTFSEEEKKKIAMLLNFSINGKIQKRAKV